MNDITLISTSLVSLGIRSISAYLKINGYSTKCIFLDQPETRLYDDNTLRELEQICEDSTIVGVSGIQAVQEKTHQVIETLRSPERKIIVGGYDATLAPQLYDDADFICRGDGELMMLELVRRIENGTAPEQRTLPIVPVLDLNELPAEDYDAKNHLTITNDGEIVPVNGLLEYRNPRGDTRNSLFYVAGRGCPYQCTFCEEPTFVGLTGSKKPVRLKDPEKVVREIQGIRERYSEMKKIYFMDPEFFSRPQTWIQSFSRLYKGEIDLPFWVFGYPTAITKKSLELLVDAGLTEVQMGIQSGSERIRKDVYRRNTPNEKIIQVVKLMHEQGVFPWLDIIFNNPYEDREDLLATIDLLGDLPKPFKLGSFGLEFLPGTPLTEMAEGDELLMVDSTVQESQRNFHTRKVEGVTEIYLNSLIRLMAGDCTEDNLGSVPIELIPTLTQEEVLDFMDQHPSFALSLDAIIETPAEKIFEV